MRLLLDTAVMAAAIRSRNGASHWLLDAALRKRRSLTLLVSVPLLMEYEAVLTRAAHLRAANISPEEVGILLDAVAAVAEPVTLDFLWRPTLPDSNDDMVLEAAENGRADVITTFNLRDFGLATSAFGVPVLTPARTVEILERKK
ncbi:MAG: PIN domain-containing protein [Alphaproteobacteria bacterium]|nr:PIN domain-containing protein [Alphaproteobacteria bacterium]